MVEWQWTAFAALPVGVLYTVLAVRQAVFVVEQHCAYQDIDGLDAWAWHLLGWQSDLVAAAGEKTLVAYARVVFPGKKYAEPSLGRVLTTASVRGHGVGKALLREAMDRIDTQYPDCAVRIAAQQYLERFYVAVGFHTVSAHYDEDGIMHVEMLCPPPGRLSRLYMFRRGWQQKRHDPARRWQHGAGVPGCCVAPSCHPLPASPP